VEGEVCVLVEKEMLRSVVGVHSHSLVAYCSVLISYGSCGVVVVLDGENHLRWVRSQLLYVLIDMIG